MSKHLTQEQRYHIEAYKQVGYSNKEIAENLKVHPATIGRELKRTSSPVREIYKAKSAHEMASLRKSVNSSVPIKMKSKTISLIEKYIKLVCAYLSLCLYG
jgi:IS30 family transposase